MTLPVPLPRLLARLLLACGIWLACLTPGAGAKPDRHPFLFVTAADVERAREGVRSNPEFARLAAELARQAGDKALEDLEAIDDDWWRGLTHRPWSELYPQTYRHACATPTRWALLARDCARASLVTNSPALADKGRQALLRMSGYSFQYEHFDTGMFYTLWTTPALEAYDALYERFTPEERRRMDAFFQRYLDAVVKNDDYWVRHEPGGKLNNHYAWHKLGRCMIGLFYGRPELVEQALRGPTGLERLMEQGFKDSGLWLEGSIPYQITATAPMVLAAELLENCEHPGRLWNRRIGAGPSLRQSYEALVTLLLPDRTLPPIGDAYARRLHLGACPDLEILVRRFNDHACAWLIQDRKSRTAQALFSGLPHPPAGAPPSQHSQVWTHMGYAALRSVEGEEYWSGKGWTAFATFSGQPIHENADKLSLMLFGNGHLWLPDCEARSSAAHAFSSVIQKELNRETLCHNTLLVDGRSQRFPGRRLELVDFDAQPGAQRLTIADLEGHLYPGVRQMRTLIARPGWVLDFYQALSDTAHDYAWMTHVDAEPAGGSLTHWAQTALPAKAPWSYLREPQRASAPTGACWEAFTREGHTLRVELTSDGPVEVVRCGFPRDDTPHPATLPMRLVECRRPAAWFLAVYRFAPTAAPSLDVEVRPAGTEQWEIRTREGGLDSKHRVPRLPSRP